MLNALTQPLFIRLPAECKGFWEPFPWSLPAQPACASPLKQSLLSSLFWMAAHPPDPVDQKGVNQGLRKTESSPRGTPDCCEPCLKCSTAGHKISSLGGETKQNNVTIKSSIYLLQYKWLCFCTHTLTKKTFLGFISCVYVCVRCVWVYMGHARVRRAENSLASGLV